MFLVRQTLSLKKSTVTHNLELMGGIIQNLIFGTISCPLRDPRHHPHPAVPRVDPAPPPPRIPSRVEPHLPIPRCRRVASPPAPPLHLQFIPPRLPSHCLLASPPLSHPHKVSSGDESRALTGSRAGATRPASCNGTA
jgi:hypothetical protein